MQKARENPLNTLVAPDSSHDRALLPLQQPGLTGTRRGRVVVAESIAPFSQSRNAQDDEVAQELIMSLLVQGMEQGDMIPTDPRRQIAKSSPHEPEVSQSKRAIIEITDKSCTSRAPKRAEFIAQINIFRLFLRIRQKRKKMCFQFSNFPSFPRFPTSLKHRREKNSTFAKIFAKF